MPHDDATPPAAATVAPPRHRLTREKGIDAALWRYGSVRSFTLRTLYSWLTLTLLFTFTWPMLVVFAGAPAGVPARATPVDWLLARLGIATLIAVAAAFLWRLSPVPAAVAEPWRAIRLFTRASGRVWPQLMVFLVAMSMLLTLLLALDDPAAALKIVALGAAESLAVQLLLTGYLKGVFDVLLDDYRATIATLSLFAATFAIRGGLAASTKANLGGDEFVVSLLAGALLGLLIGGASLWLRARGGSLLPGALAHLLALYILVGLFER